MMLFITGKVTFRRSILRLSRSRNLEVTSNPLFVGQLLTIESPEGNFTPITRIIAAERLRELEIVLSVIWAASMPSMWKIRYWIADIPTLSFVIFRYSGSYTLQFRK